MIKATILYGHPESPEAFEKYYAETHLPIAAKMPGVEKVELTRFFTGPDGAKPAYYRMADLYFADGAAMAASMGSAEGQAAVRDLANFASGGVTFLAGNVEG